jgi:hypothetical protein
MDVMKELTFDEMVAVRGGRGPLRGHASNGVGLPQSIDAFLDQLVVSIPSSSQGSSGNTMVSYGNVNIMSSGNTVIDSAVPVVQVSGSASAGDQLL